jgi:hypothetical protein
MEAILHQGGFGGLLAFCLLSGGYEKRVTERSLLDLL